MEVVRRFRQRLVRVVLREIVLAHCAYVAPAIVEAQILMVRTAYGGERRAWLGLATKSDPSVAKSWGRTPAR
ncbi:MAG: hypothetical protein AB7G28_03280 [Pirellulales bacterium]